MNNLRERQLVSLLDGLDVPDINFWLNRTPEALKELGKCIAEKAEGIHPDDIDAQKRLKPYIYTMVDDKVNQE